MMIMYFLFLDVRAYATNEAIPFDENVRRVERGSQIVLAVAGSTKLVFQVYSIPDCIKIDYHID